MILEQCLTMYDSSCHAKYTLHTTVFRETIRKLGTQRHEYLLDEDKNQQVNNILINQFHVVHVDLWMFCFN
jgi:hypothetical protein